MLLQGEAINGNISQSSDTGAAKDVVRSALQPADILHVSIPGKEHKRVKGCQDISADKISVNEYLSKTRSNLLYDLGFLRKYRATLTLVYNINGNIC